MHRLFYAGLAFLVLFELANVWLIMPLPYSQGVRSVDLAYALYSWRWLFRIVAAGMIAAGAPSVFRQRGWRLLVAGGVPVVVAALVYFVNFKMAADQMFIAPTSLDMRPAAANQVHPNRLVVGIEIDGQARAYPIQYIGYHHQVRDTVAGKPVMVSYCTVCRTGRVFRPVVDGRTEDFRLVGMDHFNAMFEDATTKSWWRQANGEAITGARKGTMLEEIPSRQVTLAQWLELHPTTLIMQGDSTLAQNYSTSFDYESGASRSKLTGTDTVSWTEKSWVVGVTIGGESKAYDWNRLERERVIHDVLGGTPVLVALASDSASFFAFERPDSATRFTLRNDSLVTSSAAYDLSGRGTAGALRPLKASQEFWHSWRTFQPATQRY